MPNTLTDNPQASHILANDQPVMRANNLYYVNTLGKDHQIALNDSDGTTFEGRHIQVSLNNRSNANLPWVSDGTDSLLWSNAGNIYFKSSLGTGLAFQMTTFNANNSSLFGLLVNNYTPQSGGGAVGTNFSAGWTFLPGGMIMQYGIVFSLSNPITVKFPINFPSGNAPFNIQLTYINSTTSGTAMSVDTSTPANSQKFVARVTNASTSSFGMYWVAIGN